MQTQSAAFKLAAAATVLYPVDRATLQTADGRTFNLGPDDILAGSLSVNSSCFSDGIEIGSTVVAECNMGLNNSDGRWDEIALEDAVLIPYSGLKLPDTTTEDFKLGTFIIDDPGYPYLQVTISASDRMLLFDEPFLAVTRTFPATNLQILQAIGAYCNVPLASSISGVLNASYLVTARPTDDITCRDVVGMIAMMAAGYARMNRDGALEIVQFPALAVDSTIDGNGTDAYTLDGLATDSIYDLGGALFTDTFGYQGAVLDMGVDSRWGFKQIREPVTVSGIQYNGTDSTLIIGADNYLVVIDECPLIQSGADAVIQSIYAAIVGFTYTGFTAEYPGNPTIDLGDVVRHITPDGKNILSLIATHNFAHGKRSSMETTAKSAKEKRYKASMAALLAAAQSTAGAAQSTANTAQSTAGAAQSTANTAQSTAGAAQSTANTAQSTAGAAQSTANTAQSTAGAAQSTANTAQSTAGAAAAAIAALAPNGLVEAAKLGTSILVGGYFKAELIDVLTLVASKLTNDATDPECWASIGEATVEGVLMNGEAIFKKGFSASVPVCKIMTQDDGSFYLVDSNNTARVYMSPYATSIHDAAGNPRLTSNSAGTYLHDGAGISRVNVSAYGTYLYDEAGAQRFWANASRVEMRFGTYIWGVDAGGIYTTIGATKTYRYT